MKGKKFKTAPPLSIGWQT